ncbi:MAG: hypothetical protein AB8V23_01440 [Candidatus Midichloria sp.]|uniref:Uncharacterized protein n=1 Tax=Hyalomma marginatum TaxID=34627 RepID=A0A8S4C4H0_9ACAR|nr:hypothetical protein MHYMCMPASI_00172 [Hyalomma marginatum]CAG7590943.1 hypothetical protein MHYMCMPSP_00384 [Hyalomma marginatum]
MKKKTLISVILVIIGVLAFTIIQIANLDLKPKEKLTSKTVDLIK